MTNLDNNKEERFPRKKLKKYLFILFFIFVFGLLIFILRGQYVSNTLKNIIVPELEAASGQRVTARKIYINLFPLFIEAKDLRVSDKEGRDIITSDKVKGYVDLTGFLSRHLSIRRLVINDPVISTNRQQIEEIIRNVKVYLEKERKPALKVKMKVIEVVKGKASLKYEDDFKGTAGIKGLSGELILGETERLKASIKELAIEKEGWPRVTCDINAAMVLRGDRIEIKRIEIGSNGSKFKGEGSYSEGKGVLKTEISLLVNSVKRLFNLSRKGEGRIYAKGEIRLARDSGSGTSIQTDRMIPQSKLQADRSAVQGPEDIFVDLKLGGNLYIETLMELLKVREKIEGLVDFQGEITGRLSNISGKAKAKLQKGNLFGVDIDSLACEVLYRDGVMKFEDGYGGVYNGTAQATASMHLPVVDFFTVDVKIHSADSKPLMKLIGWEPDIPPGKVDGELSTSGGQFNPDGWFVYKSLSAEQRARMKGYSQPVDDFLNRIKDIKGDYSLRGDILSLSNLSLGTPISNISANGAVDLARKTLTLKSRLHTDNVADLTLPYYKEAQGRGEFSGEISGTFDNPKISGRAAISSVSIEGYKAESITSDFAYQRNLLDMHESFFRSAGEEHRMKGRIFFPEAKKLFDLSKPVYDLTASIKNAEFGQFVMIFYKDFQAKGRLDADIKISDRDKEIEVSGNASVDKGFLYNIAFDSASAGISYKKGELSLKKVKMLKGKSMLAAEGRIGPDGKFSYNASSEKLFLRDIGLELLSIPVEGVLKVRSEGHGTFDNPAITVNATVTGGTFKGRELGSGSIDAALHNKDVSVNAALFNENIRVRGKAYLSDQLPWSAELYIRPGRYDFIISSFLKEVPEDLQLNLDGHAAMRGDRKNIVATADIRHVTLSLFGQTLTNESKINLSVNGKKISFDKFTVKSGAASFELQGGLEIGKEYDIHFAGSSSLSPLKALSKKIGYLKGDSDFALSVRGRWGKPEINGSVNVSNASFGLRDYPVYITSVNGALFMEGDRIVVKGLSGKIGGGNANISGVAYLNALLIKRFYLEAKLNDVTATISKDFHVNFGGDLLYRGTTEKMSVTGDIKINRARYKEPLEWRSWLFTSKGVEKPKAELSTFERAELNISVTSGENISIDNNIARASVKIAGEMLVKGIVSRPVLLGRLETTEGYVYFRNNEFKVISASVDFVDPNRIKPAINITAETTVQGYRIRLNLEGQMDRFNLSLSSEPHLEDRDILALLTSGQIGKQTKGLEAGIGAGEATSFLTGKLQDVVEERLRALTGVDRFQVEPYVSSTTGTVGPRVTVSKRLIGEKLFVTYANLMGTTEEQVIKIEYLLNKNVSLIGVRDEKGSIGGDVRFRFEFK